MTNLLKIERKRDFKKKENQLALFIIPIDINTREEIILITTNS